MALKDMKWLKCVIILILSFACFSKECAAEEINDTMLLASVRGMILKYDEYVSPAGLSGKNPAPVNISLTINNVHHLDEVTGILSLHGSLTIAWTDQRLAWHPFITGLTNKSVVHFPAYQVWTPVITHESQLDDFFAITNSVSKHRELEMHSNGKIVWAFPATLSASCPIDHRNYPFDEYVCDLRLVGSTHSNSKINLHKLVMHNHHGTHDEEALTKSIPNPVWTIVKQKSEIIHNVKRKHDDHHNVFHCTVHLRRHSPGEKFIILMPVILAMGMTLSVFWLRPASGQRMTLGGIAVLVFLTLVMYIGWRIPLGGRHIPKVVVLSGVSLMMAGLSLIISVIVSQLATCSIYRPVPGILKSFLGRQRIRQLFCINVSKRQLGDDGIQLITNTADVTTEAQPQNSTSDNDLNWMVMAHVADRICFLIYCFIFVILLSSFAI